MCNAGLVYYPNEGLIVFYFIFYVLLILASLCQREMSSWRQKQFSFPSIFLDSSAGKRKKIVLVLVSPVVIFVYALIFFFLFRLIL